MAMLRFRSYLPIEFSQEGDFHFTDADKEDNVGLFSTFTTSRNLNCFNRGVVSEHFTTSIASKPGEESSSLQTLPPVQPRPRMLIEKDLHCSPFKPNKAFQKLLHKFRTEHDHAFPNIPCSHCGVLMLQRSVCWVEEVDGEDYNLETVLGVNLSKRFYRNQHQVAVCGCCKKSKRTPPLAGPWPDILLSLPPRSRIFLSPVSLQTSLGRTVSHKSKINKYSTYRTLKGQIKFTRNARQQALFNGTIGSFVESSRNTIDTGHDLSHLEKCRDWLIANNRLFARLDTRLKVQDLPMPVARFPDDLEETNAPPTDRPELFLNPGDYPPECSNENNRYFRLGEGFVEVSRNDTESQRIVLHRGNPELEPLCFPCLYPWGRGHWVRPALQNKMPYKDTFLQDVKVKLNSVISHFRDDHYWPPWAYMEVEAMRLFQNSTRLLSANTRRQIDGRHTGSNLIQSSNYGPWSIIDENLTTAIPKFIRTGDTFFLEAEQKVKCMLQTFNIPTLFVTVTFSERWPGYKNILESQGSKDTMPSNRPWDAVQYYYERWNNLKREFLRSEEISGFGQLKEMVERHEFQLRGAIHTHSALWTEFSIEELIGSNYIRADVPNPLAEPELYRLVQLHQIHKCDPELCGRSMDDSDYPPCRKGFPAELSSTTYQRPGELRFIYRRIKEDDRWVVPYCPQLLLLWQAHCNVQYCTSGGLARYISKYVSKAEPKSTMNVKSVDHVTEHLLGRRMSSMESMVLLLSFPIFEGSSSVLYLPTSIPSERTSTVKPAWLLMDDPENPYFPDAIEKYFARPMDEVFDGLTYFQYHSLYKLEKRKRNTRTQGWKDNFGYFVYARKKPGLIRTAYRRLCDGECFFFIKLLELNSWRSDAEILGPYDSYRDHLLAEFPDLYNSFQKNQQEAQHGLSSQYGNDYLEMLAVTLEQVNRSVEDIVKTQLLNLQQLPRGVFIGSAALSLKEDQYTAYNIILQSIQTRLHLKGKGCKFFVTGPGGSGKSFLLSAIEQWLSHHRISYLKLAPTGIAANNIGGQTLHSALQITTGSISSTNFKSSIFRSEIKTADLKKIRVLIIDEISMVDSELFTFVSQLFSKLHLNTDAFGGLHVFVLGDLMQLPPVSGRQVFKAPVWKLFFPIFLKQSQRQANDRAFFEMLNEVRFGKISPKTKAALVKKAVEYDPRKNTYLTTFLVSYRKTAKMLNELMLATLPENACKVFYATDREEGKELDMMFRETSTFNRGTNFPDTVTCTPGAKVMFLNNSMMSVGISNGTCGVVLGFREDGLPNVAFPTDRGIQIVELTKDTSFFQCNGINYSRTQLPVQNAFALTVHKTQGLSLDLVVIAFDNTMFSKGQAYTALSRARRFEDVAISALCWDAFSVDDEAVKEYNRLEDISNRFLSQISHV